MVAEEYRAAQQAGYDPVLAVMGATGHSRRKSLRLIAGARDEGFLGPAPRPALSRGRPRAGHRRSCRRHVRASG